MAKKQTKKKSFVKLFTIVGVVFGILAIAALALTFVHYESSSELLGTTTTVTHDYSGFLCIFGYNNEEVPLVVGTLEFTGGIGKVVSEMEIYELAGNTFVLIGAISTVGAVACAILSLFMKKKFDVLFKVVAALLFIVAFVFCIMSLNKFFEINEIEDSVKQYYHMGIGCILFLVFNGLGFASIGANIVLEK